MGVISPVGGTGATGRTGRPRWRRPGAIRRRLAAVLRRGAWSRAVHVVVGGGMSPGGAATAGPLSSGSAFTLQGAGVSTSPPRGVVHLAAVVQVAVGPGVASSAIRLVLTGTVTFTGGERLEIFEVIDACADSPGGMRGTGDWTAVAGAGGSGTGRWRLDLQRRRFTGVLRGRTSR